MFDIEEIKNSIICGDCLDVMKDIPDNSIDLTVTSPPYDDLRTYKNRVDLTWNEDVWKPIIKELYRVTAKGGVVVWIVGDATIKGSETGTSFKQSLYFKEIGFNLHDTMIWEKTGQGAVGSNYCYWQNFEYMFVFSKGRLKTFNPICDRENKIIGKQSTSGGRDKHGISKNKRQIVARPLGRRFNNWRINQETKQKHPAPFPEKLVNDHVISWSNKSDTILDPFSGSGTTAVACKKLNRNFIGIELSPEYCKIAEERLKKCFHSKLKTI